VEHFVAYQNSDKEGRFNNGRPVREGRSGRWFTAKRFRQETIVGNRLWAIEGGGSPKRYQLVSFGIVTRLTPVKRTPYRGMGLNVHFRVDANIQPIDVTDLRWFSRLREEQRSFSYGLNRIKDPRVIAALEALRREGLAGSGDVKGVVRKADPARTPIRELAVIPAVRRSPSAANEIVRQLVAKEHLTDVLRAIAHSVRFAHKQAPSKWGLRLNRDSIMLNVGFVEMLQLGEGWVRQLVKSDLLPERMRADEGLKFSNPQYRNAPDCKACDIEDVSMLARVYSALLPAHEEAIRVAARSPRHTTTTKDHSPGLIILISQELDTLVPQPAYLAPTPVMPEEIPTDEEFEEGAATQVLVNRYERDPAARERCIEHYGTNCIACGVSLAEQYGLEVDGLIHVHHMTPLASVAKRSIVDPVRDLRPVCPNCHAVIHSTRPPLTIEQVQEMVRKHGPPLPNR